MRELRLEWTSGFYAMGIEEHRFQFSWYHGACYVDTFDGGYVWDITTRGDTPYTLTVISKGTADTLHEAQAAAEDALQEALLPYALLWAKLAGVELPTKAVERPTKEVGS